MSNNFNYYLSQPSNTFLQLLATAICVADKDNQEKLKKIYPAATEAYDLSDWNQAPKGEFDDIVNLEDIGPGEPVSYQKSEQGSFIWYLHNSGSFVTNMARMIMKADANNQEEIRKVYPQMIAAYENEDWAMAPLGFEPRYDSEQIGDVID